MFGCTPDGIVAPPGSSPVRRDQTLNLSTSQRGAGQSRIAQRTSASSIGTAAITKIVTRATPPSACDVTRGRSARSARVVGGRRF